MKRIIKKIGKSILLLIVFILSTPSLFLEKCCEILAIIWREK